MTDDTTTEQPLTEVPALDDLVDLARRAVLAADDALEGEERLDVLLRWLAAVEQIQGNLRDLRSVIERKTAPLMPVKDLTMERVGTFTRQRASKTTTDWPVLLDDLEQRAVLSPEGEVVTKPDVAVANFRRMVESVAPFSASTDAKVGGLTDLGYERRKVEGSKDFTEFVSPDGRRVRGEEWKAASITARPHEGKR